MKPWLAASLLFLSLSSAQTALAEKPYVLMQDDLAAVKKDFNDAVDRVRLVFIVGPT